MKALLVAGIVGLVLCALHAGCAETSRGCRRDDECASGRVCVVGECRDLVAGGGDLALSADGGGPPADLLEPIPDGWSADALTHGCSFNADGVLQRGEAPFQVGLGALFAVNPPDENVPVNVRSSNGTWDFSAAVAGEQKIFSELRSPSGAWWAGEFPGATYAERIDHGQAILGVYRVSDGALELLGVASEADGFSRTLLKYSTPIPVLKFPLAQGQSWTADATVSGTASGVFFTASEHYAFSVPERGKTRTPAGEFDTLRLRYDYEQTYGLLVTTRISYIHLAECYGAVARLRSRDNESAAEFTQAAEYRRLSAP
jgi:hypothetical protein